MQPIKHIQDKSILTNKKKYDIMFTQTIFKNIKEVSMQTTNPTNTTLFDLLTISKKLKEIRMQTFPNFLEFAKNVDIGDCMVVKGGNGIGRNLDFYKTLYEGSVISKEEFEKYANDVLNKQPIVEIKEGKYVLTYKDKAVHIDTTLSIAGKLFFGVDDKLWKNVEPLFLATIGYGLDISEDDIRAYIQLLNHIQTKPIKAAKEMINKLSLNNEIEKIGNILMITTDEEMIAKRLENYVLDIVDRIVRKENINNNITLLKQLIQEI
jgi:hypothetical protein